MTALRAEGCGIAFGDEYICRLSAAALPEAAKTIQPGFAHWKCTPIPAYGGTSPGGGKFTLRSALEPISTSKHSAAKICPSGEDVADRRQKGCISIARQGGWLVFLGRSPVVWFSLRCCHKLTLAPPPSTHSAPALAGERWWRQPPKGVLPQAAYILPSVRARQL